MILLKQLRTHPKINIGLVLLMLVMIFNFIPVTANSDNAPSHEQPYRMIGYFTSWAIYAPQYDVSKIPAYALTHINYAFANISETGDCVLGDEYADTQYPYADGALGNMGALVNLKTANPQLKTLISVGGYTWSSHFSDVAATDESRQHFAVSCVSFMLTHGFDGIDIDWEFPIGKSAPGNSQRTEDPENFILLLQALRNQLLELSKTQERPYLLTIAAGSAGEQYASLDWKRIYPLLDWINVMTYDMSGAQDGTTGLNAPLYSAAAQPAKPSIERTIIDLLSFGIPPEQLVLGIPFYGVGWQGVKSDHFGLYQSYSGLADGSLGPGYFDYGALNPDLINQYPRYWDNDSHEPWLYDPVSATFISYEDAESLQAKVTYLQQHKLGGAMIWELSMDDDNHSLLNALFTALHTKST